MCWLESPLERSCICVGRAKRFWVQHRYNTLNSLQREAGLGVAIIGRLPITREYDKDDGHPVQKPSSTLTMTQLANGKWQEACNYSVSQALCPENYPKIGATARVSSSNASGGAAETQAAEAKAKPARASEADKVRCKVRVRVCLWRLFASECIAYATIRNATRPRHPGPQALCWSHLALRLAYQGLLIRSP